MYAKLTQIIGTDENAQKPTQETILFLSVRNREFIFIFYIYSIAYLPILHMFCIFFNQFEYSIVFCV